MALPIAISSCDEQEVETPEAVSARQFVEAKKNTQLSQQLLVAIRHDDGSAVLQYVADGSDFEEMGEVLRLASHRGSASVVRELVAVGLTVNQGCTQTGFTALHLSASTGHLLVTELLLDALADVHARVGCAQGPTALSLVRQLGNPEVEEAIEQHIARQLVQEQGGANALPEEPNQTRLHVLPRVSQGLSEVMMRNIHATAQAKTPTGDSKCGSKIVALGDENDSPQSPQSPGSRQQSPTGSRRKDFSTDGKGLPVRPEPPGAATSPPRPPTPSGFSDDDGGTGGSSRADGSAAVVGNGHVASSSGSPESVAPSKVAASPGPSMALGGVLAGANQLGLSPAAGDKPSIGDPGSPVAGGDGDAAIYALSLGLGVSSKSGEGDQLQVQL